VYDSSSTEMISDMLLFFSSKLNTSSFFGTFVDGLHSGHCNTSELQDFLQQISHLQLESHMLASELVLQLCQQTEEKQLCTSDTAWEGDSLVFSRGDRVTPCRPKSPTSAQESYSECYHTGRSIFKHE